ncbi:hypothetical protein [Amycolatopsis silviterrae]|uniref:Uncharacterized protein n=1 Tax=Amycolatopsis silviterrae TaxID=1656914 RepID=A0ABW5H6R0_9PSEU
MFAPDLVDERRGDCDTVERCISKRKALRAVATRYDKLDIVYQGTVDVASIKIWLRDLVP